MVTIVNPERGVFMNEKKIHSNLQTSDARGKDELFARPQETHDFRFGAETAQVFDDMVNRSVPFYGEIQRMVCELAESFAEPGTNLYDIGCATGNTLILLHQKLAATNVQLIGIDNSDEMLAKAWVKISAECGTNKIRLLNANLHDLPPLDNCSVVIMLLTLQFVRPLYREKLVRTILNGLRKNGCLILVEKVTGSCTMLNRLFIENYYNYKRRKGYSELEISQKREALENVLIPYHHEENRKLLLASGFAHVEEFFRWYNFSGVLALK